MVHFAFSKATKQVLCIILAKWKWVQRTWLHLENGFILIASQSDDIIGFASVRWLRLPAPLKGIKEGFTTLLRLKSRQGSKGLGLGSFRCLSWNAESTMPISHVRGVPRTKRKRLRCGIRSDLHFAQPQTT